MSLGYGNKIPRQRELTLFKKCKDADHSRSRTTVRKLSVGLVSKYFEIARSDEFEMIIILIIIIIIISFIYIALFQNKFTKCFTDIKAENRQCNYKME